MRMPNSFLIKNILSDGSGTRLWPLSRKQYPKQYLPLASDNTMLQETILRLNGLNNLSDPIINTENESLEESVARVMGLLKSKEIIN